MPRRYSASAHPSGSSQSPNHHRHRYHSQRRYDTTPELREKGSGFDWTPSIIVAIIGTLTYLSRDVDKYVLSNDNQDEGQHRKKRVGRSASNESSKSDKSMSPPSSRERGRRRGRSTSPKESEKEGIERFYEYGPKPAKAATCEDCDDDD